MTLTLAPTWRHLFQQNFRDWEKLADFLELNASQCRQILQNPRFPLNLPIRLAQKIAKGTLDDPILKQFLPMQSEALSVLGYTQDPVGDFCSKRESKLLHKYQGRVLLVCSSVCAMHCRYCFRQHFDYETEDKSFDKELSLIAADESIAEVILSGGDPLSLPDRILHSLLTRIAEIPHIKRIRFHTRFIIGIPERIDDAFLEMIKSVKKQFFFVIHINHGNELDEEILNRVRDLQNLGAVVLNQTVLLKGINDDVATLLTLCKGLVDHGILPYYLHQLDRVAGAAHFEVEEEKGKKLIQQLNEVLPGYAVPKYVREVTGEPAKVAI